MNAFSNNVKTNDVHVSPTLNQYIVIYIALSRVNHSYMSQCPQIRKEPDFDKITLLVNSCVVRQLGKGPIAGYFTQVPVGYVRALWDIIPALNDMAGDTYELATSLEKKLKVWS